jgi:hypothetical protein
LDGLISFVSQVVCLGPERPVRAIGIGGPIGAVWMRWQSREFLPDLPNRRSRRWLAMMFPPRGFMQHMAVRRKLGQLGLRHTGGPAAVEMSQQPLQSRPTNPEELSAAFPRRNVLGAFKRRQWFRSVGNVDFNEYVLELLDRN